MAAAIAGASVGFLRHNFPPARIFLGDAGSLLLGFLLAVLGLILDLDVSNDVLRIGVQALILGVPLFDTALVVISRVRGGRPVLLGGTDHSSHRLSAMGLSGRQVALATYGAQLACSTIAIVAVNAPEAAAAVALAWVALGLAAGVGLFAAQRRGRASTSR
jgi:UDP-GlcNAc:undecaprenyl-phosphate GlcNAc-1-phosphate transferase